MTSAQHDRTSLARAESRSGPGCADGPLAADVQLTAVTEHGWRLTDRRLPLHDPFRLLAFIERRGDRFEVMQMGAGFEWHAFDSLPEALDHVVATAPGLALQRLHDGPGRAR